MTRQAAALVFALTVGGAVASAAGLEAVPSFEQAAAVGKVPTVGLVPIVIREGGDRGNIRGSSIKAITCARYGDCSHYVSVEYWRSNITAGLFGALVNPLDQRWLLLEDAIALRANRQSATQ